MDWIFGFTLSLFVEKRSILPKLTINISSHKKDDQLVQARCERTVADVSLHYIPELISNINFN